MRKFLNLIFQLVAAALLVFIGTAIWIVADGLSDQGGKADVALVTGHATAPQGTRDEVSHEQLDRVSELFKANECSAVIVVGSASYSGHDGAAAMAKYLEDHEVPSASIIKAPPVMTSPEMAREVAGIMKKHQFESVMLVTDYYRMTRMKLALNHDGIAEIGKAHVGKFEKGDLWPIGREVIALYHYVGTVYLLPAAEKAKEEAEAGADKAKVDAEKAKKSVDKSLDNMAK